MFRRSDIHAYNTRKNHKLYVEITMRFLEFVRNGGLKEDVEMGRREAHRLAKERRVA